MTLLSDILFHYLTDRDALNGMVTLERLKKEHKKAGGGRGELWLAVATHLRSLLSPQPARLESLAKYVLVHYIV